MINTDGHQYASINHIDMDNDRSRSVSIIDKIQNFGICCKYFSLFFYFEEFSYLFFLEL